jgi:hypothetical protein
LPSLTSVQDSFDGRQVASGALTSSLSGMSVSIGGRRVHVGTQSLEQKQTKETKNPEKREYRVRGLVGDRRSELALHCLRYVLFSVLLAAGRSPAGASRSRFSARDPGWPARPRRAKEMKTGRGQLSVERTADHSFADEQRTTDHSPAGRPLPVEKVAHRRPAQKNNGPRTTDHSPSTECDLVGVLSWCSRQHSRPA